MALSTSLVLVVVVVACTSDIDPGIPDGTVVVSIVPGPTDTPVPIATMTPAPSKTLVPTRSPAATRVPSPAPTGTPTPALPTSPAREMSPADIYAMVSPSVAYIRTPDTYGSGFLVEDGYVVTNHHVVWPFEEARVVFPDGKEFLAPVVAWDPLSDTAVVGPVNVAAPPVEMGNGEELPVGSELYLLGYPGEEGASGRPTIVSGLLSHYRQWNQMGITYFQTDAVIAGGQSGGVLTNAKGEVIGMSGLTFTEAGYALVASAVDLEPIVRQLIRGDDPWEIRSRRFREQEGGSEFSGELRNHWDTAVFLVEVYPESELKVEIESPGPAGFRLVDRNGTVLEDAVNDLTGGKSVASEIQESGTLFLTANTSLHDGVSFDISSNAYLYPFTDPDDGRRLHMLETIAGNIDYGGDVDWYSIELEEGETVRLSAESWNVDTLLYVDVPGSQVNQVVHDDDSGGGLFGTNSQIIYSVPKTGDYILAIRDASGNEVGGYLLSAERAPAGTKGFTPPSDRQQVESPFGTMAVYESLIGGFSVQVPADWTEAWPDEEYPYKTFEAVEPEGEGRVAIMSYDLSSSNEGQTLEELVALVQAGVSESGATIQNQRNGLTRQGDPLVIFEAQPEEGLRGVAQVLISVRDERFAFVMVYGFEDTESSKALVEYSFGTLESSTESSTDGQYFRGRTLDVSVVSLERVPELRYSTVDPNEVIRRWTLFPSDAGNELVLVRLKVENHTVASATFNIDRFAAELRDSANAGYQPISIGEAVWQDFHGEPEALVRVDLGHCFDGGRALIEPGTTVRWQSDAETAQYLAFEDTAITVGPHGRAELGPGESLSHAFDEPGTYHYICGNRNGAEWSAEVRVMPATDRTDETIRSVLFLRGPLELLKGNGVDDYMVFEVPAGTEFQDLRWLAGDSIKIPL